MRNWFWRGVGTGGDRGGVAGGADDVPEAGGSRRNSRRRVREALFGRTVWVAGGGGIATSATEAKSDGGSYGSVGRRPVEPGWNRAAGRASGGKFRETGGVSGRSCRHG